MEKPSPGEPAVNVRRTAMAVRVDRAVVIEAAINGETRPEKNPHVPRTPEAIARDASRCLDAGASLLHAHYDDIRLWGREAADDYLAAWRPVLRERPDTLWYPTLTVAPDHAVVAAPLRAARPGDRPAHRRGRPGLDQHRRPGRRRPAGRHRLRERLRGDPRELRALRQARPRARRSRSTSRASCARRSPGTARGGCRPARW